MNELIEKFKLSDVHRAGAIFEEERMAGFNAEYIKAETLCETLHLVEVLDEGIPIEFEKIGIICNLYFFVIHQRISPYSLSFLLYYLEISKTSPFLICPL